MHTRDEYIAAIDRGKFLPKGIMGGTADIYDAIRPLIVDDLNEDFARGVGCGQQTTDGALDADAVD